MKSFLNLFYKQFLLFQTIVYFACLITFLLFSLNMKFFVYPNLITDILIFIDKHFGMSYIHTILFHNDVGFISKIISTDVFLGQSLFCINDIFYFMLILGLTIAMYYFININKSYYKVINVTLIILSSVAFLFYLKLNNDIFIIYSLTLLVLFVYFFINFNMFIISRKLMVIPILNILCFPNLYVTIITKNKKFAPILKVVLMFCGIIIISNIFLSAIFSYQMKERTKIGYNFCINNDKTFIDYIDTKKDNQLSIVEMDCNLRKTFRVFPNNRFFNILSINYEKNEIYNFDNINKNFLIFDYNTLELKKKKKLPIVGIDFEKIDFDNESKTISLALEHGIIYIFDMNTLDIIEQMESPMELASVCYNRANKSYVFSYWLNTPYFMVYSIYEKTIKKYSSPPFQGEIEYSNKNKELYIPYHEQGQIYVLDAETYKLKRKINVRYSVKNLYYSEQYNILVAASYYTGFIDIILMDGSDEIIGSKFLGFLLRRPILFNDNIYIASWGKKYKYNVKNLLNKLSNKEDKL